MNQPTTAKMKTTRMFYGLGRILTVSLLLFALVPMMLVSILSYKKYHSSLEREIIRSLENVSKLKTLEINSYFKAIVDQVVFQAGTLENKRFLKHLDTAWQKSGKSLKEFVRSSGWSKIAESSGSDLKLLNKTFNFHDILLINKSGDVLFSAMGENDLGTNIFTGEYRSTKFATACKRSVGMKVLSFSDYEMYKPSNNQIFGFITAPVKTKDDNVSGIIGFQFKIESVTDIMKGGVREGDTLEYYLIGPDKTLRSEFAVEAGRDFIERKILTKQTEVFLNHIAGHVPDVEKRHKVLQYEGPRGEMVLGIHEGIGILNTTFGIIAEIEAKDAFADVRKLRRLMTFFVALTGFMVFLFAIIIVRRIVQPLLALTIGAKQIAEGDFSNRINLNSRNEIGDLAEIFNNMTVALKKNRGQNQLKDWFQAGQMELNTVMNSCQDIPELSREITAFIAGYIGAHIGAFYLVLSEKKKIRLSGSYSFSSRKNFKNEFSFGEGLVGEAALLKERMLLKTVPADYLIVSSGLGEAVPNNIVAKPFTLNNEVLGIIELGTLDVFDEKGLEFLDQVSESIALNIQKIKAHIKVQELLIKSQNQTEELEVRQKELHFSNKRLEEQTTALRKSENSLKSQQAELGQTNMALSHQSAELEEQAAQLETQKRELNLKNEALEKAKADVEVKAIEVSAASKYKSEFLANMSHELRTPLNSILLLSKHLSENKDDNLSDKQVECAATVHSSGNELLCLINEVLDLAKIESGHMAFEFAEISIQDVTHAMDRNFRPVADDKGLDFEINIHKDVPEKINTDIQRLSQILKNLLSNAFKFTDKGMVTLEIAIDTKEPPVRFMVRDTGSGISESHQEDVFHAFKQADGSTSRKYGGTGLGLSISREFALALGGWLELESRFGEGSVFTLALPLNGEMESEIDSDEIEILMDETLFAVTDSGLKEEVDDDKEIYLSDDRNSITEDSRTILVIDDDKSFAKLLRNTARKKGFKALIAGKGGEGLSLTEIYKPDGIILDMGLPDMGGNDVLFRLKNNLTTRHIPVHIISGAEKSHETMRTGAVGFLNKPVSKVELDNAFKRINRIISEKVKKILVVEDDLNTQNIIKKLIGDDAVEIVTTMSGIEAKKLIEEEVFSCIILDLVLPDMTGEELLGELRRNKEFDTPVIIHTARELSEKELALLDGISSSIIAKDARSHAKLLDDTCLFLHRVETDLSDKNKKIIRKYHDRETILENKKILIVDDDMRNVFSLISVLEDRGINVIAAKNGKESIAILEENPDTNLILMDIMMPVMDGYDATRAIRKMDTRISRIPVIALTAKAMKGDRAKCLEAGANDYMSKPVDIDKLLSMLRVWLYQK